MKTSDQQSDVAVVLASHGSSKDVRINQPMFELAESIAQCGRFGAVTPAFLDGQPSVQWVLDEIQQECVVVIPFMASCGYYTDVVFPKHLQSNNKQVQIAPPIGIHHRLAELVRQDLVSTLAMAPADANPTVVVVGHGTRRNKQSCLTTIRLVKDLRKQLPERTIKFAFIDQRPFVDHVFSKTLDGHVVVIPFLMGFGPHTTADAPEAFGAEDLTEAVLSGDAALPMHWQTETNGKVQDIYFAKPVGSYRVWAEVCIALATELIHTEAAA